MLILVQVYAAGEWRHRKKSGEQIIVDITVSLISYHDEDAMLILIKNITEKRKLEQKLLEEKLNRQKQITAASIRMQEKERELIGRELHDNVNQILASAKLYIEYALAEQQLHSNILEKGKQNIAMAMNEIRKLSKALVAPSIGEVGLRTAITDLVDSLSLIENMQLDIAIDIDESFLNGVQKLMLYRVIQEQVTNIVKHANASHVSISIQNHKKTASLIITDNGVGFDKNQKKKGIGLNNIKSRIKALAGNLTIDTAPGHGCRLAVRFPLTKNRKKILMDQEDQPENQGIA